MIMDKKLFSVITPVYNTKKYLAKCIESVQNQSFTEFEFIIVDDGSTDGSGEICDHYAEDDLRIRVIHKENGGQGSARNKAIESAKGDYLVFLDSDDFIRNGLLEYLAEIVRKYTPEMIVYKYQMVNERRVKSFSAAQPEHFREIVLDKEGLWNRYLNETDIGGSIGNKCVKRSVLLREHLEFPLLHAREDVYLLVKLFQCVDNTVLTNYMGYVQTIRYGSTEQAVFSSDFFISIEVWKKVLDYLGITFQQLYPAAYKKSVNAKINCLQCMIADGKHGLYASKAGRIYDSLKEDLIELRKLKDCESECMKIEKVLSNSRKWKIDCCLLAIARRKNRLKRFLYAKIF